VSYNLRLYNQHTNGFRPFLPGGTIIIVFLHIQAIRISPMTSFSESALRLKDEGNALFKQGKFNEARVKYSHAIELDSSNPIFFANRAACNLSLKR
jgi:tetratricopeptide (TPR) repeat protein